MSNINFDNPWLLLLAIPLLLIVIISFILSVKKDNRTPNNIISFLCHLVITILLTLAIARTTFELVITETNVYVLADVSYSSNDNLDLIDQYIDDLKDNCPKNSKIGVVCFGKDYELLVKLGDDIVSVKNSKVDNSSTDISGALKYTASLFDDNVIKRIVIISDGEETNESNIVSVIQGLSLENIYVDAIYLDNNLKQDAREVQINEIIFDNKVYLNDLEEVHVTIQSSYNTKSYVSLYCDDELYEEKAVMISEGLNTLSFNLNTSKSGFYKYKVVVNANDDESIYNNEQIFVQNVSENLNVLFIGSSDEDREVISSLYDEYVNIDYYINKSEIPFTVEELSIYDEFIIANFDVRNIFNATQFLDSINTLVSEFGKNLITIGNTYIQNNDGDELLDEYSQMLPVVFDNKEQSSKLVALVIDISRSMENLDKLKMAKQSACTILDNLDNNTDVLAIAFYGDVGTVFRPTSAADRESLKDQINNLEAYQGTFMGSALEYTYKFMTDYFYDEKEVILISDGLPYEGKGNGAQADISKNYVSEMAKENISVSAIHVFELNGITLMKDIARIGRGNYYFVNDLDDVESLILNDVLNSLNDVLLVDNESVVSINKKNASVVEGIDELPNIKGLYNNRKKSSANVILNATYKDLNNNEFVVPLYATWAYGTGNVSTFASTISGDWVSYWNESENGTAFIKNLISSNKPSQRIDSAFIINDVQKGTMTEIIVDAPSLNNNSLLMITIKYPDNSTVEKELVFNSENYTVEFTTDQIGNYDLILNYSYGNLNYTTEYSFCISYLPEYNLFTKYEASNLYYMVSNNGQVSENGKLILENDNSVVRKYFLDFTAPFMVVCVILFVVDVIVRKLRLQDIKSLFKKVNKKDKKVLKEGGSDEK